MSHWPGHDQRPNSLQVVPQAAAVGLRALCCGWGGRMQLRPLPHTQFTPTCPAEELPVQRRQLGRHGGGHAGRHHHVQQGPSPHHEGERVWVMQLQLLQLACLVMHACMLGVEHAGPCGPAAAAVAGSGSAWSPQRGGVPSCASDALCCAGSGCTGLQALVWHGAQDVRVEDRPRPLITDPVGPAMHACARYIITLAHVNRQLWHAMGLHVTLLPELGARLLSGPSEGHDHLLCESTDPRACARACMWLDRMCPQKDAILRVTATAICGSDLHLYLGALTGLQKGEGMRAVREGGSEWVGQRV